MREDNTLTPDAVEISDVKDLVKFVGRERTAQGLSESAYLRKVGVNENHLQVPAPWNRYSPGQCHRFDQWAWVCGDGIEEVGMTRLAASALPDWPAAMNQQMAAAYCGISVETFTSNCPVQPVVITASKSGKRYLRRRLDEWLLSLDSPAPAQRQGMGALRIASREAQRA